MNKNLLIALVILGLSAIGLYLIKGKPSETGFDLSDRNFKIENIDDVYFLSIERKNYPIIIFNKKGNEWYLNNGRKARVESINNILNLMNKLRLKFIPNSAMTKNIINSINSNGIKVKMFDKNDKLIKSFYLGPDQNDGVSAAFLMDGATQPYCMESAGFNGSIRTRFEFEMNEYETKHIFQENSNNIDYLEVKYPKDRGSSFAIKKTLLGYDFYNPYTNTKLPKLNEKLIEPYLSKFEDVVAEYNDAHNPLKDSIMMNQSFMDITLKRKDGTERKANFYSLRNIEFGEQNISPKDPIPADARFSVATNNGEFFLVQYRVVNKIMLAFDSFSKR